MLSRGLRTLECVALNGGVRGVTVNEVAVAVGLDRSVTSRLLSTLRELGYLRRDVHSHYRLSAWLPALSNGYSTIEDVRTVSYALMDSLYNDYALEVNLGTIFNGSMVFTDYRGPQSVLSEERGAPIRPAHRTAVGLAVLAELPDAEREEALHASLARVPSQVAEIERPSVEALIEEARSVRYVRYAPGDRSIRFASAILDHTRRPVAAICISGSETEVARPGVDFGLVIKQTAAEISATISQDFIPGYERAHMGGLE